MTCKGPQVVTFGCRLNAYESEVITRHMQSAGMGNTVVVNSCAVTAEAVRQARQTVRRLQRENPDRAIIVTGCAAQIDPQTFAHMEGVTSVIGNDEKLKQESFEAIAKGHHPQIAVNDIFSVRETAGHMITGFGAKSRAFVQIQNGCNHRCTFCIIPYGRGNSRSVPMGEVIGEIKGLVDSGLKEIVLTGVDITSYGEDLPGAPSLGQLVQKILKLVPDLPRLRISSIDSIEVDTPLMDAITGETRVMPHLHLSLQAGDNMVLKRMKRRHTREDAITFTRQVRKKRPDIVFGADIIAGFPTETDAMFEESLKLIEECDLTWLHIFPYSAREGTPAARMPQVKKSVRKERAALLRDAGQKKVAALLRAKEGQRASVLVERQSNSQATGHSEHFIPVEIAGEYTPGTLLDVRLARHEKPGLMKGIRI